MRSILVCVHQMPNRVPRVTSSYSRLNMGNYGNQINISNLFFLFKSVFSVLFFFFHIFLFKANTVSAAACLNSTYLGIFKPTLQGSLRVLLLETQWFEIFLLELIYIVTEFLQKIPLNQPKSFKCQFVVSSLVT